MNGLPSISVISISYGGNGIDMAVLLDVLLLEELLLLVLVVFVVLLFFVPTTVVCILFVSMLTDVVAVVVVVLVLVLAGAVFVGSAAVNPCPFAVIDMEGRLNLLLPSINLLLLPPVLPLPSFIFVEAGVLVTIKLMGAVDSDSGGADGVGMFDVADA